MSYDFLAGGVWDEVPREKGQPQTPKPPQPLGGGVGGGEASLTHS